ncbi:MAG TPA: FHA domain-containing protein [Polyangia bacterium]|nr:FHA domain-containing protein [Polyangia bacterium]
MTLGLVCDSCDALSPLSATTCQVCGASLGIVPARGSQSTPSAGAKRCPYCNADVAPQHRFCGSCGRPVSSGAPAPAPAPAPEVRKPGGAAKTMFFGAMQASRAKLILIKGEGMDGVSYMLSGTDHVAGRLEGAILFPEDPLLSPRHANFVYRDNKLFVRDEGSCNGVFVRIMRPQTVTSGATFLVGEQLLRVEAVPPETVPIPDEEGTYFYGSPKRPSKLQLVQMLAGGRAGMIFRAREDALTLGRENNDVNFPDDPFISGRHAIVSVSDTPQGPRFVIADQGSKNGTFLRTQDETPLFHGDYVFIGQQLLRVEIT